MVLPDGENITAVYKETAGRMIRLKKYFVGIFHVVKLFLKIKTAFLKLETYPF